MSSPIVPILPLRFCPLGLDSPRPVARTARARAEEKGVSMDHPFQFRPGTCDEEIFRAVVKGNEYQLPESFATTDIILDVGTHIGSFSYACVLRGSCNVHTFE